MTKPTPSGDQNTYRPEADVQGLAPSTVMSRFACLAPLWEHRLDPQKVLAIDFELLRRSNFRCKSNGRRFGLPRRKRVAQAENQWLLGKEGGRDPLTEPHECGVPARHGALTPRRISRDGLIESHPLRQLFSLPVKDLPRLPARPVPNRPSVRRQRTYGYWSRRMGSPVSVTKSCSWAGWAESGCPRRHSRTGCDGSRWE
jgi:hypothetical protein